MLVAALLLLLALSNAVVNATIGQVVGNIVGICDNKSTILNPRPHSVSITEFGAVGDGKSLNTIAFQNAIFYLKSFADKGGAQLYVPSGRWLTGSFNLTSHLTLFLEKGAVILGSQDPSNWEIVEPLPSYGRGIELPGRRYRSLINGYMLHDVVITGDNGTIEGQGFVWWDWYNTNKLNYTRPHLIEFISSKFIVISNLTLLNSPAYSIHHVYCSDVHIQNILVFTPPDSPQTIGIVPDSSNDVCIEDCRIITGYDSIALKSGWDEYRIAYGVPTANVQIRHVHLQSSTGSCLAFGSEMSGGIRDIHVQSVRIDSSSIGVSFRTTKGRGGYIKDIFISDVDMEGVFLAFEASGQCGTHPDDSYDPFALPEIDRVSIQNVIGRNISLAGKFTGIPESPFSCIFLSNISLSLTNPTSLSPWTCSDVSGCSSSVFPAPCPDLEKEEPLLLTSSSGGLLIQSRLSSSSSSVI